MKDMARLTTVFLLLSMTHSIESFNTRRFLYDSTYTGSDLLAPTCAVNPSSSNPELEKAKCILDSYPLIDGHDDLADVYRIYANNSVNDVDLRSNIQNIWNDTIVQTDIPRLRAGHVGGKFWSCYVSCHGQYKDAVRMTVDQLDVIKRFVKKYPDVFQFATTAQDLLDAFSGGKIGSIIGLEGGHSIDSSLGVLRMYYELGVRYMTVTHSCNTPWADNWHMDQPEHANDTRVNGLTEFGKEVILEMNRLGMMVDLAHVAKKTMSDVLDITKAPVIFSHSSVFSLCNHYRNVQDDILLRTRENGGIIMINFYDKFVVCPPYNKTEAVIADVADHVEYVKNLIGVDHVGIGGDFSGIPSSTTGLEDNSKYPYLFAELIKRGWSEENLQKLAGKNIIRVLKAVEQVRDNLSYMVPYEDHLPPSEYVDDKCRTDI